MKLTQRPLPVAGYAKERRSLSENYIENKKVLQHVSKYKTTWKSARKDFTVICHFRVSPKLCELEPKQ